MNRQGSQGILDGASNSILENEFGTRNEEDVVKQILEKGSMQETEVHIHSPSLHLGFLTPSILNTLLLLETWLT